MNTRAFRVCEQDVVSSLCYCCCIHIRHAIGIGHQRVLAEQDTGRGRGVGGTWCTHACGEKRHTRSVCLCNLITDQWPHPKTCMSSDLLSLTLHLVSDVAMALTGLECLPSARLMPNLSRTHCQAMQPLLEAVTLPRLRSRLARTCATASWWYARPKRLQSIAVGLMHAG